MNLEQLGQILVGSLWQGATLGAVLMILLLFVRQAKTRYALSCLTLFAMLGWFVFSWVQVSSPSVAASTLGNNYAVTEQPSPSTVLEPAASPSTLTTNQPFQPTPQEVRQLQASPTRQAEARAFFPTLRLQTILPYVSVVWMLGVAVLSVRLLLSFYLLKRYQRQSFELMEPWLLERIKTLAKRLKVRQHVTLLQTNTLAVPAVMGVVKPIVLIPSSLISGLSVGQLDMILAHELAHIKRRDYLVNILQTLAETLLFYHPVVWWVSRVIRQERENCCDDVALQITGQSALEYADVLLRLEKSRQGLALAATNGSLLRRVERLLNPPKAGVSVGSSLAALLLVACLSLTFVVNAVNAQPIQVSKVPYVFNADIALDPTNPERIAVTVNKAEKYDCKYILCQTTSLLYSSSDGGGSWQEQDPYGKQIVYNAIQTAFDETGAFYTVTNIGFDADATAWTYVTRADEMVVEKNEDARLEGETYGAKIAVHPETGVLYMVYLAIEEVNPSFSSGVPEFRTSLDGGKTWSEPTRVVEKPVWEINEGYPFEADIFLGDDERLAVVWTQDDGTFTKTINGETNIHSSNYVPYSVWIVLSNDGGKTFTEPRRVGESWGRVATAYLGDSYYIMTKQASFQSSEVTFEYRLLYSQNKGVSWNVASISRDVEVYSSFPYEVASGLSVASDGTVDVVFYGRINAPECISIPAPMSRQWTDKCDYNVYYTSSQDDGTNLRVFSDPQPLNEEPIVGSQFVRLDGMNTSGWFLSIASTNDAAYPVWIGNREGVEGTQAYMLRIER